MAQAPREGIVSSLQQLDLGLLAPDQAIEGLDRGQGHAVCVDGIVGAVAVAEPELRVKILV